MIQRIPWHLSSKFKRICVTISDTILINCFNYSNTKMQVLANSKTVQTRITNLITGSGWRDITRGETPGMWNSKAVVVETRFADEFDLLYKLSWSIWSFNAFGSFQKFPIWRIIPVTNWPLVTSCNLHFRSPTDLLALSAVLSLSRWAKLWYIY